MSKLGTKALADAFKKGIPIIFRAESVRGDLFICRAEWKEAGIAHYALGKRFRTISDQKADFLADEIMRAELGLYSNENHRE